MELILDALPLFSSSSDPSSPSLRTPVAGSRCQQITLLPLSKQPFLWPLPSSQLEDHISSGPPTLHCSTFSSDLQQIACQPLGGSQEGTWGGESPPSSRDDPANVDTFLESSLPLCLCQPWNAGLCFSCCPSETHPGLPEGIQ